MSEMVNRLVRPNIRCLPGGENPFETPERTSKRLGIPVNHIVKLDANENVYGPSPKAVAAVAAWDGWHLYPDAIQLEARKALGRYVGVDERHILLTNGGDELIALLCQVFLSPGDNVVELAPSFEVYSWDVRLCDGEIRTVLRDQDNDYAVDPQAIRAAIDGRTKMLIICNPNNPTGTFMPVEEIVSLLDTGVVVFVDEAYYEFCGQTVAPLVTKHDNLIVLRTMSKWAGLAGLRAGYAVASPAILEHLWKVKLLFNVNLAAQIATIASLEDLPYLMANVQKIIAERERLYQALQRFPFLRVYPSKTNFILCRVLQGNARELRSHLERQGILVRHFDKPHLPNALRITVGKPEHTDRLVAALEQWR